MQEGDIQLTLRSDPRLLGSVRSLIRGWLEAYDLSAEKIDAVVLAIDEACANCMRHAYEGRIDGVIELTLRPQQHMLEFLLADHGVPCPEECLSKRSVRPSCEEELKPGGLGVPLMFEVFDDVDFRPGDERGNRVTLRVKRPK